MRRRRRRPPRRQILSLASPSFSLSTSLPSKPATHSFASSPFLSSSLSLLPVLPWLDDDEDPDRDAAVPSCGPRHALPLVDQQPPPPLALGHSLLLAQLLRADATSSLNTLKLSIIMSPAKQSPSPLGAFFLALAAELLVPSSSSSSLYTCLFPLLPRKIRSFPQPCTPDFSSLSTSSEKQQGQSCIFS